MNFSNINKTKFIIICQSVLFLTLIMFGLSGSSISYFKKWAPDLISMDDKVLIGHPKEIRSDEWAVNTLLSIGQYQNKESRNPRITSNLGPAPRDMSIVHDTGVPTSELSTLSKVNLWGFFVFDLRRALAWDWWVPVFVGLNGIWLLLNLLFPGQSLFNFSLALLFALAPECVMWSNWPLLHVGTASLAVSMAILATKTSNLLVSLALAFVTGLLVSWFALQLYLPRLIPVALISAATYAGYCISRHVKFFNKNNCIYLLYTLLISSLFLFDWFYHNYDAILKMLNSSYPGQRRVYGGIPFSDWDFNYVRGWLFPVTGKENFFAHYRKLAGNTCEVQSYIGLFIPVAVSVICYLFKSYRKINYIVLFNFVLLLIFIAYEYIGLPKIIGSLTFLNRSWTRRAIIGIGFTTLILLAFLYKYRNDIAPGYRLVLLGLYLVPFLVFLCTNRDLVDYLAENYSCKLACIAAFVVLVHAVFLFRIKYVTLVLLLFVAPVTLFWNPVTVAPSYVDVNLPEQIRNKPADLKHDGRFLVISKTHRDPNLFFASGYKVMNGTFHYIDSYIYDHFYNKSGNPEKYKRFHHLLVMADNAKPDIGISLRSTGAVGIRLNARDYNFTEFPVDYVVARKSPFIKDLNSNATLKYIDNTENYYFYKVKH